MCSLDSRRSPAVTDLKREDEIRERVERLPKWDQLKYVEGNLGQQQSEALFHAPADLLWCLEQLAALRRRLELAEKLAGAATKASKEITEQEVPTGFYIAGLLDRMDEALAAFRADEGKAECKHVPMYSSASQDTVCVHCKQVIG